MKKFKIFAPAILMAAVITFISGCSDISGASVGKSGSINSSEKHNLTASVSNFSEHFVREESSARSINPAAWTLADKGSNIRFYLYGKATNNVEYPLTNVTANISDDGDFNINLPAYNWTLWLFAAVQVPTSFEEALTVAALVGRAHADLTASATGAIFRMTSLGLSGKGFYSTTVKLDNWEMPDKDPNMTATIGIYNRITGEPIKEEKNLNSDNVNKSTAYAFNDMTPGIDAGIYLYKVSFLNPATKKTYYYSDIINIVPQKESRADLIIPDIIGEKPAKPASFAVAYDKTSESSVAFPDYYSALFKWEDSSVNERNFEIQIVEITTPGAITPTYGDTNIYGEKIIEDTTMYVSGSLLAGSEEIVLRLPLGKRYGARIRAVNDAGPSEWVTAKIATATEIANTAASTELSASGGELAYFVDYDGTTTSDTINLLRVVYHVQGGTWIKEATDITYQKGDGTTWASGTDDLEELDAIKTIDASNANYTASGKFSTSDRVLYFSKKATTTLAASYPLWKFADNALQYQGAPLTSWSKNSTSAAGLPADTTHYNEYENVEFYANYTPRNTIEIVEDKSILEPKASWLTIAGPTGSPLTLGDGDTKATVTDGGTHKITFSITVPASLDDELGTDKKYDKIQIQVKKSGTTRVIYNQVLLSDDLSAGGSVTEFPDWTSVADGLYILSIIFTEGPEIRSLPDIALTVNQGAVGAATVLVTSITLSQTTLSLAAGEFQSLTPTVLPATATDKSLTWSSDNEGVATVSSAGLVTGAGSGTATITATANDGSGKTATCTVTVGP